MRVSAGPVEATAIGNIAVQLLAEGVFKDVREVRQWIKELTQAKFYFPSAQKKKWDQQFSKYQQLLHRREKSNAKKNS